MDKKNCTPLILRTLRQTDDIEKSVSPRFLVRNWPPAFKEWNTKAVRDAFYASPQFPRLLNAEAIKDTIARGVSEGLMAYVGKSPDGGYSPFIYKTSFNAADVEISEDMYIITAAEAEKHIKPPELTKVIFFPSQTQMKPGEKQTLTVKGLDQFGHAIEPGEVRWTATGGNIGSDGVYEAREQEGTFTITAQVGNITCATDISVSQGEKPPPPPPPKKKLIWSGEITPQKWMNFYTKVLTKFVKAGGLSLKISIQANPVDGVADRQVDETKAALRELGLDDEVRVE